jgi:hypothetical protein
VYAAGLDDVDGYRNLQELLGKLDAALHVAPQAKEAAAAAAGGAKASSGGPRGSLAGPLVPIPLQRTFPQILCSMLSMTLPGKCQQHEALQ